MPLSFMSYVFVCSIWPVKQCNKKISNENLWSCWLCACFSLRRYAIISHIIHCIGMSARIPTETQLHPLTFHFSQKDRSKGLHNGFPHNFFFHYFLQQEIVHALRETYARSLLYCTETRAQRQPSNGAEY